MIATESIGINSHPKKSQGLDDCRESMELTNKPSMDLKMAKNFQHCAY